MSAGGMNKHEVSVGGYEQARGGMNMGRYERSRDGSGATCPSSLVPLPPYNHLYLYLYYLNIFTHFIYM